jgi:hypothetical protein
MFDEFFAVVTWVCPIFIGPISYTTYIFLGSTMVPTAFLQSPRGRPSLWIWPGARLQESSPENPVLSKLLRMDRFKGKSIPGNHANFPPKKHDKTGNMSVFQ